jgi:tetratricopeptide (TPR) repeat protein
MLKNIFLILVVLFSCLHLKADEDPNSFYQKGVDAHSIGERESNFEKALKLYMNQEISLKEKGGSNGYLLYNIGNCYFNLNQLGESILYYKQALKLLPFEEKILKNYEIALKKRTAAVDIEETGKLSETLLFFHYSFSEKNKIIVMLISSILVLILFLINIKMSRKGFRNFSVLFFLIYALFGSSLIINYYLPEREGVFVKESMIHQDTGDNYASLVPTPFGIGSSIRVLNEKGGWYKVQLNDGRIGYIKESNLRLVL